MLCDCKQLELILAAGDAGVGSWSMHDHLSLEEKQMSMLQKLLQLFAKGGYAVLTTG